MSDADASPGTNPDADPAPDEDDVVRINMRLPRDKYEWLQGELDSFTSDTARIQYLIQFYSDQKQVDTA